MNYLFSLRVVFRDLSCMSPACPQYSQNKYPNNPIIFRFKGWRATKYDCFKHWEGPIYAPKSNDVIDG